MNERCTQRPEIGSLVIVHSYTTEPFKARVLNYYQCAADSVRVKPVGKKNEEWVVLWKHCSPNGPNPAQPMESRTPRYYELRDRLSRNLGRTPLTYHVEEWMRHAQQLEIELHQALAEIARLRLEP